MRLFAWAVGLATAIACSPGESFERKIDRTPPRTLSDPSDPSDPVNEVPTDIECYEPQNVEYNCDSGGISCPEGFCVQGLCLGPLVDDGRWDNCADTICDACEIAAETCPADCGPAPTFRGSKAYDVSQTLSIKLHGWTPHNEDEIDAMVYGEIQEGSALGDYVREFSGLPSGVVKPDATDQVIEIEYVGAIPASTFSQEEIEEIESYQLGTTDALHRFALIVAKTIRHKIEELGIDHVNLFCHSMGCHLSRYLIENDVEGLASGNVIVRWTTLSGPLHGARLARLFDNDTVQDLADALGMHTVDFVHMHPDYVTDHVATWDHKPYAANNPLFKGILIHHVVATNPALANFGVPTGVLNIQNEENEPNDGIVYSNEQWLIQNEDVQYETASGDLIPPSRTYLFQNHDLIRKSANSGLAIAASLLGSRKVVVTLKELVVFNDRERDDTFDLDEEGLAPAEVAIESRVWLPPWNNVSFHQRILEDHTLPIIYAHEHETFVADQHVFSGPVFDDTTELRIELGILEVDNYAPAGLQESFFNDSKHLANQVVSLPIETGTFVVEGEHARATFSIDVHTLY